MTPTQQDKELQSKLDRLIIENQSEDGSIDISDQRAMRDEIMQLITADRKRVALEARIDELQQLVDDNSWQPIVPGYNVSRLERRITELKHRLLKEQTNDETL